MTDAGREDHGSTTPAVCDSARAARQHLDDVDRLQVGVRLEVHALVDVDLLEVGLRHPADRDAAREQRLALRDREARGGDGRVLGDAPALDELHQEVARVADRGPDDARGARRHHLRADADRGVGDQRDLGGAAGDARDLADEAAHLAAVGIAARRRSPAGSRGRRRSSPCRS